MNLEIADNILIDKNLRAVNIGDTKTALEIATDKAKISNLEVAEDLKVEGTIDGTPKYFYQVKVANYYATTTNAYVPLAGYVIEKTSTASNNEFIGMIAPYNGSIVKIQFRSEIAQSGAYRIRVAEAADGTEVPGTLLCSITETIDIADDTTHETVFGSMGDTTANVDFTKGRLFNISINSPSAGNDTNVTILFKWDLTS